MVITSVDNNKIKELSKLKESKYRKKNSQFIVEGYHLVEEANKYNRLEEVFLLEDITYEINVPCTYVSKEVMKKLLTSFLLLLSVLTLSAQSLVVKVKLTDGTETTLCGRQATATNHTQAG